MLNGRGYLNAQDAATYLGITLRMVRDRARDGMIPFYRIGNRLLFQVRDLDKYMNKFRIEVEY